MQAFGIFQETFPGSEHLRQDGMIDRAFERKTVGRWAAAQHDHKAAGFDDRREAKFAIGIQELDLTDLTQIKPHRILQTIPRRRQVFSMLMTKS